MGWDTGLGTNRMCFRSVVNMYFNLDRSLEHKVYNDFTVPQILIWVLDYVDYKNNCCLIYRICIYLCSYLISSSGISMAIAAFVPIYTARGKTHRWRGNEQKNLVGGLERSLFSHVLGMSSSKLTNSYFSEGFGQPPTRGAEVCYTPIPVGQVFGDWLGPSASSIWLRASEMRELELEWGIKYMETLWCHQTWQWETLCKWRFQWDNYR